MKAYFSPLREDPDFRPKVECFLKEIAHDLIPGVTLVFEEKKPAMFVSAVTNSVNVGDLDDGGTLGLFPEEDVVAIRKITKPQRDKMGRSLGPAEKVGAKVNRERITGSERSLTKPPRAGQARGHKRKQNCSVQDEELIRKLGFQCPSRVGNSGTPSLGFQTRTGGLRS